MRFVEMLKPTTSDLMTNDAYAPLALLSKGENKKYDWGEKIYQPKEQKMCNRKGEKK